MRAGRAAQVRFDAAAEQNGQHRSPELKRPSKAKMMALASAAATSDEIKTSHLSRGTARAVARGEITALEAWLRGGGHVDAATEEGGNTMLIGASIAGEAEMVSVLLRRDANVDVQNNKGASALMHACYKNHAEVVRRLLGAGATLALRTKDGGTAADMAEHGGEAVVKLLRDHQPAVRMCILCEDAPREVRFPCGHACCCYGCVMLVQEHDNLCPQCREPLGDDPVAEAGAHVKMAATFHWPACAP
jgi:hypothetical protein